VDRLVPSLIISLVILIIFGLMIYGWASRRRRQAGITAPTPVPTEIGSATLAADGWYVATTRADQPLERIAVHGLGFRAHVAVSVYAEGVVFAVRGIQPFWVTRAALRGAGRATWAIDRVVERDGLVLMGWLLGDEPVDTYLRLPDPADATALLSALQSMTPTAAPKPAEGLAS